MKKRIKQHNDGKVPSTSKLCTLKLIHYEACLSREDAFRREKYLKTGIDKRYLRDRFRDSLEKL